MISIIISAFHEEDSIHKSIESFAKQNFPDEYEFLIISDPDTKKIVQKYAKRYKQIVPLNHPLRTKASALNICFRKAKGNIWILSDADTYIKKNAVTELLKLFKNKKVGAVTGRTVATNNKNTMLGYWAHLQNDIANKDREEKSKKGEFIFCNGSLFAMKKDIVKRIPEEKCLDDAYISALIWKAGYKIKYTPKAIVYREEPTTIKDWIKQKRRNALGHIELKNSFRDIQMMKSFTKESLKWKEVLFYSKNLREFLWTLILFPFRLSIWLLAFYDNATKKTSISVWKTIRNFK